MIRNPGAQLKWMVSEIIFSGTGATVIIDVVQDQRARCRILASLQSVRLNMQKHTRVFFSLETVTPGTMISQAWSKVLPMLPVLMRL